MTKISTKTARETRKTGGEGSFRAQGERISPRSMAEHIRMVEPAAAPDAEALALSDDIAELTAVLTRLKERLADRVDFHIRQHTD